MGWGTYFTMTHYFNRETYTCLSQVEDAISETKRNIQSIESEINALALMTEPKKFISEESDPLYTIQHRVKELMEEYGRLSIDIYMLSDLKENWDECHKTINGEVYGIEPDPKEGRNSWEGPRYYCSGDFIKTVYPDGTITEDTKSLEEEQQAWKETINEMRGPVPSKSQDS